MEVWIVVSEAGLWQLSFPSVVGSSEQWQKKPSAAASVPASDIGPWSLAGRGFTVHRLETEALDPGDGSPELFGVTAAAFHLSPAIHSSPSSLFLLCPATVTQEQFSWVFVGIARTDWLCLCMSRVHLRTRKWSGAPWELEDLGKHSWAKFWGWLDYSDRSLLPSANTWDLGR